MKIIDGKGSCSNTCNIGDYITIKFEFPNLKEDSKIIINNPYKARLINKDGLMLAKDYYIEANNLVFEFVTYKSGSFNVVPINLEIDGVEYVTQGYDFTVLSTGSNLELKDIVNAQKIYPSLLYFLSMFSAFVLLVLLIILLIKKIKIKKYNPNKIFLSPYEKALRKINLLEFDKELKNNLKKYISSVSEIVKTFIDEEYKYSVLDLTTTELIQNLKRNKVFEEEKIILCKNFFNEADLIKFKEKINLKEDKNFIEEAKKLIFYLKKEEETNTLEKR